MQETDFFDGMKQAPVKIGPKNVPFPCFIGTLPTWACFCLLRWIR